MIKKLGFMTATVIMLSACTVGPDFERPEPPKDTSYTPKQELKEFGEQKINSNKSVAENWWKEFSSPELDETVQLGIQNSHQLTSVRKDLEQAIEGIKAQKASLWPSVNLDAGIGRTKYGAAFLGPFTNQIPPFTYYEIGPSVTYLVDLFGITRRAIEKQEALSRFQLHVFDAAYLGLTGNIVAKSIDIASLNAEIAAVKTMLAEDKQTLKLVEESFKIGAATQKDVIMARSQLSQDEAMLPGLKLNLVRVKNELNSLVGKSNTDWTAPDFTYEKIKLPNELPLTLPSELVHTRPDILAAESILHSTSASIGIAVASFFPNIILSGNVMQQAVTPAQLLQAASTAFQAVGNLTQPLFTGGLLNAQKKIAILAFEGAYANYKEVVVKALLQVNDVLNALYYDYEQDRQTRNTLELAKQGLELARKAYSAGGASTLQVLEAQRKYSQARLGYAQIQGKRYHDTLQLYLVLGGHKINPSSEKSAK